MLSCMAWVLIECFVYLHKWNNVTKMLLNYYRLIEKLWNVRLGWKLSPMNNQLVSKWEIDKQKIVITIESHIDTLKSDG